MFDYVLAGIALIACCVFCIASIKWLNPVLDKMSQIWQMAACQLIGSFWGLCAVALMIEAVK